MRQRHHTGAEALERALINDLVQPAAQRRRRRLFSRL
jgi:hypothetical protein